MASASPLFSLKSPPRNMDDSKILDWDIFTALGLFPELGEVIIWTGSPNLSTPIPGITTVDDFLNLWLGYYCALIASVVHGFTHKQYWFVIVPVLVLGLFQVLPAIISYHKIHRTQYIVTNKRIIFNLWSVFNPKVHWLRYDDFQKTNLLMNNFDATTGTIYLMTGKEVGFWTYDFDGGERRHHPSLEYVQQPVEVSKKIEALRIEFCTSSKFHL